MVPMSQTTRIYRYLALFCHLGLLAWVTIWQFTLVEERVYSTLFISLIYILPLLLPLRGILAAKPYTHAWANFIVLFYVIHGFTAGYAAPDERLYAVIELVLATGMFVGCSAFARKRGRELGLKLKKLKDVMQEEKNQFENRS